MTNPPDPDKCTLSDDELALLARIDERTELMDENIDSAIENTEKNAKKIADNRKRTNRNATILAGYSAGLMAILMWSADKISRIL